MAQDDKPATGEDQKSSSAPSISLPKGGGAIRGIGEKFAANPATGTGSTSVPIACSPGRSGFGPQLSLNYDSGAGNGPFGFGWSLGLPQVTRKTDKGLPQYNDAEDSDVFILSGTEDLVPVSVEQNGTWVAEALPPRTIGTDSYTVRRYRPRVEGLFARIERWTRADGDIHWRSISKDNILTLYGKDSNSRIADPLDPLRIFTWLICENRDDKGNAVLYEYKPEDGTGVDLTLAHERNRGERGDLQRATNRYLKRIRYGNRVPLLDNTGRRPLALSAAQVQNAGWMFEVVFDYGEHVPDAPKPGDVGPWRYRSDPFSSYRAGFEVRTTRLCQRVLMFHHFAGEPEVGADCLVRSNDFRYSHQQDPANVRNPVYTFLLAVTQSGYKRNNGGYDKRSLPPVEYEYTQPVVQDLVQEVDAQSLENLPIGVEGTAYQWTDLHGDGIPGILTEQAGAWFYKRNVSPISERPVEFAPLELVAANPNLALTDGQGQFMDLAGDGQPDLVVMNGAMPGLYEHDEAESWQAFRPFTSRLNRDTHDPNLKFIDLNGDGHADVLITEDDAFVWHASLAEEGFGAARRVQQALDEEKGPRLVFADGSESVYLSDLNGDGLTDLVRIRSGEVCYWPNLGYGRFGAKVTMDHAPHLDHPDQFDHKRIRLADIDGSGTTDLIYLHRDGVRLYFNQSGNSWSQAQHLNIFPHVDDVVSIVPTDLLGNGTACLVWSSPLAGDARRQMRYVDLMGGVKPHLLVKTRNNLGAETRVRYVSSTKFYLQDKRDGKPWVTRLPFPVQVVERVETYDHISRNRFVTRYAYHHGYFDGQEREFRGFGMVEQWDTEEAAAAAAAPAENLAPELHVPPVLTKSWFHTGVYLGRDHLSEFFAGLLNPTDRGEYFREPGLTDAQARALLLPDTVLPEDLSLHEEREASRALKGSMLRREIYALDGSGKQPYPYIVTEQNFGIRRVQPRGANPHAVFFTHPAEAINFHYERNPADPRIQHILTLEVDGYGNVLKQATVGYGRRTMIRLVDALGQAQQVSNPGLDGLLASDQVKQITALVTYTDKRLTSVLEELDDRRNPLPCEEINFELTGYTPTGSAGRYQPSDFVEPDPAVPARLRHKFTTEVPYESAASGNRCRRAIEHMRTLYRRDDLTGPLPFGTLSTLALPFERYKLAFTPGLLTQVFQRPRAGQAAEPLLPNAAAVLAGQAGNLGGYLQSQTLKADGRFPATDPEDYWWSPSGQSFFTGNPADNPGSELAAARQHFFLARRVRDAFGQNSFIDFDANDLLMRETRDALGNRRTVDAHDYRVLQPRVISDPNRNQSAVAFDALGMVAGTAVMGKPLPAAVEGDSLAGFVSDLAQPDLDAFFGAADLHSGAVALLKNASTRIVYDLHAFMRTAAAHPSDPSRWQPPRAATLVRETHASAPLPPQGLKIQISISYSDGFAREIQQKLQAEPGPVVDGGPAVSARWVCSGWTICNNKGKPVRQYEPFFSATHNFEFGVTAGVSPVLFYDPLERAIATLHPNHTFEKLVFDPWQQTTFDANDTSAPRNAQTGDPRTDPDIAGYVAKYFNALPVTPGNQWQTWHAERIGIALGEHERNAALRAAAHADTPETTHVDALGRPFLNVTRNRVACTGHDLDGTEGSVFMRTELDIEGNQRSVRDTVEQAGDALGRIVMRYAYDLGGNRIYQTSQESGARWLLNDVAGKPIRAWDSRGHNLATVYDALRRPIQKFVRGTSADSDPRTLNLDILVDRVEYGEGPANAEALNLRTCTFRHFDSAGVVTDARLDGAGNPVEAYDFKGNLLYTTRRLVSDYRAVPDWQLNPALDAESFEASTRYDAMNRPIQSIPSHSSLPGAKRNVIQPVFNEANLLERIDVWLARPASPTALVDPAVVAPSPVGVANIDYDAKGKRQRVDYKNGASTFYDYDRLTHRLTQLLTQRAAAAFPGDCSQPAPAGWPGCQVQNLHYVFDPAGNITHLQDDAQQAVYFRNQRVEPSNDYTYDALYRLIQATGREHLGQTGGVPNPSSASDALNAFHTRLDHRGNGQAMGTYVERYVYDPVGNFLQMQHRGSDPANMGWTRAYAYAETSQIEDGSGGGLQKTSNRLTRTTLNPGGGAPQVEPYQHDAHGNVVRMPHLGGGLAAPNMLWDYKDQLRQVDLGGGGAAYYVYDGSGERVRKVVEKAPGLTEERITLGGFETFRRHNGAIGANSADGVTLERETLHVMDDRQRIALIETRTLDTAASDLAPARLIRYQIGNHLGSSSLELDDEAQIVSYEEHAPYGSTTYQAVRSQTETPKRYRFTGKERDEESGLYRLGARYYADWLGRWMSADPAGLVDGPDLYRYSRDNPIMLKDPGGHQPAPALDPETVVIVTTALQRAAAAWGTAGVIEGGVGVGVATESAPLIGASGAAGLALVWAAAFITANVLTVRMHMQRSASIVMYGNPYGMPGEDIAFPLLKEIRQQQATRWKEQQVAKPFPEPVPPPVPKPAPKTKEKEKREPLLGRVYVTYSKYNSKTKLTYSGRTSAVIDLNLPWQPQAEAAVAARDANHHVDENDEPKDPAFGAAQIDKFAVGFAVDYGQRYRDLGYLAMRGREQQLIDFHGAAKAKEVGLKGFSGGAWTDTKPGANLTENSIRGVGKENPFGEIFHAAANLKFGELAPYTGFKIK